MLHAARHRGGKGGEVNRREALPNFLTNYFDFVNRCRILPRNRSLYDAPDILDWM